MKDTELKLIVHRGSTIYDSVIVTPCSVIKCEQKVKESDRTNVNTNTITERSAGQATGKVRLNENGCNAYVASLYIVTLTNSQAYRKAALEKLSRYVAGKCPDKTLSSSPTILIKLRTPRKEFLDCNWNERVTEMAMERREVDHAMSWLSTLGGAFSALGEEFQRCAEMAGKISVKQFELALRLGDPLLVARCQLYAALSLIQQDRLRIPKQIVRNVYKFSIAQNDVRLERMCQGIWAKLKYSYKMRRDRRKSVKT